MKVCTHCHNLWSKKSHIGMSHVCCWRDPLVERVEKETDSDAVTCCALQQQLCTRASRTMRTQHEDLGAELTQP